jgi:hypothetical protein
MLKGEKEGEEWKPGSWIYYVIETKWNLFGGDINEISHNVCFELCIFCLPLLDSSWDGLSGNMTDHERGHACDIASRTGNRKYQESCNKCGDFQLIFTASEVWVELRLGCKSWVYLSTRLPVAHGDPPCVQGVACEIQSCYLNSFKAKSQRLPTF